MTWSMLRNSCSKHRKIVVRAKLHWASVWKSWKRSRSWRSRYVQTIQLQSSCRQSKPVIFSSSLTGNPHTLNLPFCWKAISQLLLKVKQLLLGKKWAGLTYEKCVALALKKLCSLYKESYSLQNPLSGGYNNSPNKPLVMVVGCGF